jgi:ubiquinone/menaquinone biosynthesis C-methylase UbiE
MPAMTDQEARYDRIAEGYATWWSPIHRPVTLQVLDVVAPVVAAGARRILDIGCGTGALAAAAVRRWPDVRVTGIDVSAGMLAVADRELGRLQPHERARIDLVQAPADRLPFEDGTFDLAVTTFVLQLVPSAYRALREARRVLRADGSLAFAAWLEGGRIGADDAYADALEAAGMEPPEAGGDHGDPRTPSEAAARLRRAGFADAVARPAAVDHAFTTDAYVAFVTQFDDADRWEDLSADERAPLEADLRARLDAIGPEGRRLWLPVAIASGRRTGRP